jgi:hypothetical protein
LYMPVMRGVEERYRTVLHRTQGIFEAAHRRISRATHFSWQVDPAI